MEMRREPVQFGGASSQETLTLEFSIFYLDQYLAEQISHPGIFIYF